MKSVYRIIKKMILTEKVNQASAELNRYCFEVEPGTNKLEIKRAVEQVFKVRVTKICTLNKPGKLRRERSMKFGRTPSSKRAFVTLAAGDKIETV